MTDPQHVLRRIEPDEVEVEEVEAVATTLLHPAVRVSASYREDAWHRCESIDVVWERDPPSVSSLVDVARILSDLGDCTATRIGDHPRSADQRPA